MLQFLKRYKQLFAGIVIGTVLATAGAASSAGQNVTATLVSPGSLHFWFNGIESTSPETVLNYKGSNYVPVRYIVEGMQGTVEYDAATKSINIDSPYPGSTPTTPAPTKPLPVPSNPTPTTPTTPATPPNSNTLPPLTPDQADAGRNFGLYKEVKTAPVSEVSKNYVTIPATYKLESNAYATRVSGIVYNTSGSSKDVVIKAEFYNASNKLIARGLGVVNKLAPGTSKSFLCYADTKIDGISYYRLTVE